MKPELSPEEAASLIDTSKMSAGQRAALEITEAARETTRERTFAAGLPRNSISSDDASRKPAKTSKAML